MLDFRLHAGPPGARACVCVCACVQQRGVVSTGWPWHRSRFQRLPRKWGRNDSANSVLKTDRESDFGELTTTLTKGQSLQKKKKRKKEDVLFIYFYFFVFLSSMRVWKNDPVLDGELVITSGAWRLSHFNTLTALHILETKQIKNAWWSGTYLEFSVVAESARVAGSGEMQLGEAVFSAPTAWYLTWWMKATIRLVSVFLWIFFVIHASDLNERSDLPEVRRTSLETTGHLSLS